uniref:Indole diterpene prenyltransferase nodD2 n=1 Tax=Hypoxylon pulicicidum TaxID=1243767 RepID=NODD2_HYPPI|nr:RecName: Full=Indole diterpene prenyltransferase nodD2; AltName: Full=Nodulisporic acid biosynthesis cluster protein D2 [Hypoxylon pulicicidum]AUM60055.1 prenyl transferase [Hypoxylon pulicicidum]
MDSTGRQPLSQDGQPWQALASGLGFPDEDQKYWWSVMAPLLGELMKWANYPVDKQYLVLAFCHEYILPFCGPRPTAEGGIFWPTLITKDGTPFEPSLNFYKNKATLRVGYAPACELSGSNDDPINQRAPIAALEHQKRVLPQQNLKWVDNFKKAWFIDNDDAVALKARVHNELFEQAAVQCLIGYVFSDYTQVKVAMSPLWKSVQTGQQISRVIWDTFRQLGDDASSYLDCLSVLEEYTESKQAKLAQVQPSFVNFDVNLKGDYQQSRLKVYYATPCTAFDTMVQVFTLGGRLKGPEVDHAIECLRVLWPSVLAVPENHPDDQDLPRRYHSVAVTQFNFELWPGAKLPVPQIYLPTNFYGRDELEIAEGLEGFFKTLGWSEPFHAYKQNYIATCATPEGKWKAIQHDVSFSFKDSSPYVSVYYKPELSVLSSPS